MVVASIYKYFRHLIGERIETFSHTRCCSLFLVQEHSEIHRTAVYDDGPHLHHVQAIAGVHFYRAALYRLWVSCLSSVFLYVTEGGAGHIQTLVLGGALVILGLIISPFALLADLVNFNRELLEVTLEKVRQIELGESHACTVEEAPAKARDNGAKFALLNWMIDGRLRIDSR